MWWRCSECNRLVGKHRRRCVVCGAILCRWCGRFSLCTLHYGELDSKGKEKVQGMFAVYLIGAVLLTVFYFIFLVSLPYSTFISKGLVIGSMFVFFLIALIWYFVYRGILLNIHSKHS
jgi:hypothetical protein